MPAGQSAAGAGRLNGAGAAPVGVWVAGDALGSLPAAGSKVIGGGVDGIATRSASTSCDSEVMRTLVSSTRSLTMRRSLPMPSTVSF